MLILKDKLICKNTTTKFANANKLIDVFITNCQTTCFAIVARYLLNKIINSSNKTTIRFQTIQDSYNTIFDFIVEIDVYALLKNIVKFVNKLIQIVKIIKLFKDNFQNNFATTNIDKTYLNVEKSIYR